MNTTYDTLLLACEAAANSVFLPFKVPNGKFDPPNNGQWIEFIIIPNGEAKSGWQDLEANQGLLRALVYWTPNTGTEQAGEACQAIATAFAQGVLLFSADNSLKVEIYAPPVIGGVVEDGQKVYFPVSVRYRSFAN